MSKIEKFQRNLSTIFIKLLNIYTFSKIFQKVKIATLRWNILQYLKKMSEYFSCNERLEIFLTCFWNILCYVGITSQDISSNVVTTANSTMDRVPQKPVQSFQSIKRSKNPRRLLNLFLLLITPFSHNKSTGKRLIYITYFYRNTYIVVAITNLFFFTSFRYFLFFFYSLTSDPTLTCFASS